MGSGSWFGVGNMLGVGGQGGYLWMRKGVARVDDKIDDPQFDLRRIGIDRQRLVAQVSDKFDSFGKEPLQQLLHVGNDMIQINHSGQDGTLSAERQQLARKRRGSPRRF